MKEQIEEIIPEPVQEEKVVFVANSLLVQELNIRFNMLKAAMENIDKLNFGNARAIMNDLLIKPLKVIVKD